MSSFTISNDIPAAPTNLAGNATEADNDGVTNDASLTWTAPPNPDVASYTVEQATVRL